MRAGAPSPARVRSIGQYWKTRPILKRGFHGSSPCVIADAYAARCLHPASRVRAIHKGRSGVSQTEIGKRILNAKQQPVTRQAVSKALASVRKEFLLENYEYTGEEF